MDEIWNESRPSSSIDSTAAKTEATELRDDSMQRTIFMAFVLLGFSYEAALAGPGWRSGTSGGEATGFASWRGAPLELATGFAPFDNWTGMLNYMSGNNPRTLRARSANVSMFQNT